MKKLWKNEKIFIEKRVVMPIMKKNDKKKMKNEKWKSVKKKNKKKIKISKIKKNKKIK